MGTFYKVTNTGRIIHIPSYDVTQYSFAGQFYTIAAATQASPQVFDHTYTYFCAASSLGRDSFTRLSLMGFTDLVQLESDTDEYWYLSETKRLHLASSSVFYEIYNENTETWNSLGSAYGFGGNRNYFTLYTYFETITRSSLIAGTSAYSGSPPQPYFSASAITGSGLMYPANVITFFTDIDPFIHPPSDDPYSDLDGEEEIGGGGTVGVPGFPGLTATSTGIVGLFAPSAAQMQQLADFMWTDFGGTGTTIETVLSEIVEALKRLISNPLDYILGLNIIPSQGLSIGGSSTIKFGFVSSGVPMPRLSNQYFTVDCGSLTFDAVCGNTFLDYAPYSKFSIYLPYIGFREVDANDFVGHTIGVLYHGDVVTGGLTAYITKDGSVMYQFSGSCALNIPLSSDNWGSTLSAAVNIATTVIAGAASGGAAGVAKAAAMGAASVAANPSLLSPQVAHSGAVSGAAGAMGVQYPFIIREAVRFHSTEGFNTLTGYPSYYFRSLSEVSGYTKVLDLHLENIPATQDEIAEIESILKEGAIF